MLLQIIIRYLFGPKKNEGMEVVQGLSHNDFLLVATPVRGIDRGKLTYGEHGITITSTEHESKTATIQGEKRIKFLIFAMIEVARQMKKHKPRQKK